MSCAIGSAGWPTWPTMSEDAAGVAVPETRLHPIYLIIETAKTLRSAIPFLVVTILGKFAWGPVLGLLQEREKFIHKSLADAKRDREEAEARLKEYAAKIQAARAESAALVDEARRDAERLREDLKQRARTEAEGMIQNAERQISLQTQRAIQEIRREAVDLSVAIASKIIQRNLTKEDNQRLIDEAIRQVGSGGTEPPRPS